MKSLITVTSRVFVVLLGCSIFISTSIFAALPGHDKREFTSDFDCPSDFLDQGTQNKYFPLDPASEPKFYSSIGCDDCEEVEEVLITVTPDEWENPYSAWLGDIVINPEMNIDGGIDTRIVMEEEWEDDTLIEVSFNYFAICQTTGDVFYFGEDVINFIYDEDECEVEGEVEGVVCTNNDGSWRADEDEDDDGELDGSAGMIMPGSFMLGARYFQEYLPEKALDRGENVAMGLTYGFYNGVKYEDVNEECVQVNDTNALEDPKGKEFDEKIYCADIGLAMDEDMALCNTNGPVIVENGEIVSIDLGNCIEEVEEEE